MRGLPKIRRRGDERAPSEQPTEAAPPVSPDDQPTIAYQAPPVAPPAGQQPAAAGVPPADMDPAAMQVASAPSFRDRGRLRRRLAYLRRVRELGFRDLGGLVFDLHRFQRQGQHLVDAKLNALAIVDGELRALERVLRDKQLYMDLREPGIAACPRCAALHGSDANFCPSCGIRLSGPLGIGEVGGMTAPPPEPAVPPGAPIAGTVGVSVAEYGSHPVAAAMPRPPVAGDPEPPTAVAPQPAAEPEPVAAEPEPEPVVAEPEPEPEPVAAEPAPDAAADEPELAEPAPDEPDTSTPASQWIPADGEPQDAGEPAADEPRS